MSLVRNVLLVGLHDDEAASIRMCLQDGHGCSVHHVNRGQEALDIIRKAESDKPFHVIISETRMSPINGVGLANQLRSQELVIPIILVSDNTVTEHVLASATPYYQLKDASGAINLVELMKLVHMVFYHELVSE